ncbi:hypothetical protein A1O1_00928 [Capronia coronata CBS 617.96]|uniref:Transcription factor domain-containing protein n=1 Tax=Capronia coronata CBS 617.96 TaxID=1182541 RepID=W9ZMT6_9EURO|nr:uncharacterized protein A1O1_00928 [Capronia coronata CBS 617.96]EXJ95804.1 hypothetical protein A1O1_00928 [Capronia coronata CBS 617.96]
MNAKRVSASHLQVTGRRRKIKCNYPSRSDSPPDTLPTRSNVIGNATGDPTTISPTTSTGATTPSTSADMKCIECLKYNRVCEIQGYVDPKPDISESNGVSRSRKQIYKRRREATDSSASPDHDRRVKVRVHRMHSMVERLARERGLHSASATNGSHYLTRRSEASGSDGTRSMPVGEEPSEAQTPKSLASHGGSQAERASRLPKSSRQKGALPTIKAGEESIEEQSPLLSQLFNNEVFTQTPYTPAVLIEKKRVLSFLDGDSSTDVEKLRSTIASEPDIFKALDICAHWWVAWRDQAFALHEAFFQPALSTESSRSGWFGSFNERISSRLNLRSQPTQVSLQDFVRIKLSQDTAVSVATGLFCIVMSLQQLRPGVDDLDLHLSTSPADLAERIVMAVDAILLSRSSNPAYRREPGILLLFMMRAKMYAETHQLRKSWLMIRRATETTKAIGFTDVKNLPSLSPDSSSPTEEEINLFHRQRFVGSILELERLMSMVLGLPHAEDENFSDRLALAVLRGEIPVPGQDREAPPPADIKMRALRRVVAVAAGRVNDRNASSESLETKLEATMKIQNTLDEATSAMPAGWWNENSHLQYSDQFAAYEHLHTQMWYWQVQAFLHMPFMLTPASTSPQANVFSSTDRNRDRHHIPASPDPYLLNRYLCLQGCRNMLCVFNLLRSEPSLAVYICPCEDFQGVFSACILMVGLLLHRTYPHSLAPTPTLSTAAAPAVANLDTDLALIEDVKDVFRYRAPQQGGGISKQGLRVLEVLGSFLVEDFESTASRTRTVVLPYFGAIHLQTKQAVSTEDPVKGAIATDHQDLSQGSSLPESDLYEDATFQFPMEDFDLNWDQFMFGDELGQDWNLDTPDFPIEDGQWE